MTFRLELSSALLLRLYRVLVVFVAVMTTLYTLTLSLGLFWKIGGAAALAVATYVCLRLVARMSAKEVFAPLTVNGWALFAFILTLVISHAPIYRGESSLGDWAKHRSVMLSLHDNLLAPKASGFLYDETAPEAPIPANFRLNYYYLSYLAPVVSYTPLKALVPDYARDSVARVLAALLSLWSLVLLLCSLALVLSCTPLLLRTKSPLSESTLTLCLLIFPLWGGGEFFLEIYRQGEIPRLGPHYDGIFYDFFPIQVQNMISLWNWVPSQMAGAAVGLALLFPFCKRVELAPWPLIVAFLMGSIPFALCGLGPIALFAVLQSRERYTFAWLKGHSKQLALTLVLSVVLGLQAVFFFKERSLQDAFLFIFDVSQNYLNYAISVTREYVALLVVLLALTLNRTVSWLSFAGLVLPLLAMTTVYLGQFNPWSLKSTIPFTLLLPIFFSVLVTSIPRRRTQVLTVVLALIYFLPSFWYEIFFAWMDASHAGVLEKTKWIVDQYLGV